MPVCQPSRGYREPGIKRKAAAAANPGDAPVGQQLGDRLYDGRRGAGNLRGRLLQVGQHVEEDTEEKDRQHQRQQHAEAARGPSRIPTASVLTAPALRGRLHGQGYGYLLDAAPMFQGCCRPGGIGDCRCCIRQMLRGQQRRARISCQHLLQVAMNDLNRLGVQDCRERADGITQIFEPFDPGTAGRDPRQGRLLHHA